MEKQTRKNGIRHWLWLVKLGVVLGVALAVLALLRSCGAAVPGLDTLFPSGPLIQSDATGIEALLPDEELGYNRLDFINAILGEAREKKELVVLEQDVQVDTEITNAIANISLFQKTKVIHSFGVGVYTVDLNALGEEDIDVDMDGGVITVRAPHTKLQYVNVDASKTTFEQTEHAIFGFGDIKLTQEEQQAVDESIEQAMRDKLDTEEMYQQADKTARVKLQEIFQPLVSAVADTYTVTVELAQ